MKTSCCLGILVACSAGVAACGSSGNGGPPLQDGSVANCTALDDCPDGGAPTIDGGSGNDGGSKSGSPPNVGGWTTATSVTLPSAAYAANAFDFYEPRSEGCPDYFVWDIDNDGKNDLVFSDDCANNSTVGDTHWLVYLGTGTAFASSSTDWSLPMQSQGENFQFPYPLQNLPNAPGGSYSLSNFTGHGDTDLYLNGAVYPRQGNGFATNGITPKNPSSVTSSDTTALYDLTGDGILDLVLYSDGTQTSGVGTDHWLVYPGTGMTAFSSTAITWPLPSGILKDTFQAGPTGNDEDTCSGAAYVISDLNGDGKPDLIITDDCDSSSKVGVTYWNLYAGSGKGFATSPAKWAVPNVGETAPYDGDGKTWGVFPTGRVNVNGSAVTATTEYDFDKDGHPDLFIASVDGVTLSEGGDNLYASSARWYVYLSTGSGFSPTAGAWTTPIPSATGLTGECSTSWTYAVTDFNLDGIPDLAVSNECTTSGKNGMIGTTNWEVYFGAYK